MGSVVLAVWLILSPEAVLVCSSITIFTGFGMYTQYVRVVKRFAFDESQTVDFNDIFYGPANISANTTKGLPEQHQHHHNVSSHSTGDLLEISRIVNGGCQQYEEPENTGRRKLIQPRGDAFLSGRSSPNKQLLTV